MIPQIRKILQWMIPSELTIECYLLDEQTVLLGTYLGTQMMHYTQLYKTNFVVINKESSFEQGVNIGPFYYAFLIPARESQTTLLRNEMGVQSTLRLIGANFCNTIGIQVPTTQEICPASYKEFLRISRISAAIPFRDNVNWY